MWSTLWETVKYCISTSISQRHEFLKGYTSSFIQNLLPWNGSGFIQKFLGQSFRPSHNSKRCPLDIKEVSPVGCCQWTLEWCNRWQVMNQWFQSAVIWTWGWIQITCCSASLKHYLYSRRVSQATQGLLPVGSMVSCFTAPDCLNNESACLQLASYRLQPHHSMMSCHFSTLSG